jgi:hypothetical protein
LSLLLLKSFDKGADSRLCLTRTPALGRAELVGSLDHVALEGLYRDCHLRAPRLQASELVPKLADPLVQ